MRALSTGIPCGSCPGGVLTIRDDGYVYCPVCNPEAAAQGPKER